MGGYTQTMKVILDTNLKCTDRLDEEGVSIDPSAQIKILTQSKHPACEKAFFTTLFPPLALLSAFYWTV